MNGKELLLKAVTETIEMLPIDFGAISTSAIRGNDESATHGEQVVGIMTDNQKIILSALEQMQDRKQPANEIDASQINIARKILEDLFSINLRNTFKQYYYSDVFRIRKGFEVISYNIPSSDNIGFIFNL